MQQFANSHPMREKIINLLTQNGLGDDDYIEMLDFTIDLFESQGLGSDYYGYHNINHELEVTYVSLLAAKQDIVELSELDIKYLYVAALFHDFDPQKSVDKPHEESVLKFIASDKKIFTINKKCKCRFGNHQGVNLKNNIPMGRRTQKKCRTTNQRMFS